MCLAHHDQEHFLAVCSACRHTNTGMASYMRIAHHTTLKHDTLTLVPLFGVMESDKHGPACESVTPCNTKFRGNINHVQ